MINENQLPETAIGTLKLMPSTAFEVAKFSTLLIKSVRNGEINPLELIVQLHALTKVYEEVREEIEENVLREAEKFPEKVIERYGARIEKSEVGTKYNYLKTGDLEYEELHAEAESANRKLKEREAFLRALKEPQAMISRHGESYTAQPPFKTSKSGFKIYLTNIK
jgi:hypothetical protein